MSNYPNSLCIHPYIPMEMESCIIIIIQAVLEVSQAYSSKRDYVHGWKENGKDILALRAKNASNDCYSE